MSPTASDTEYSQHSKLRRLAIFLVTVGEEAAGEIMKHLDDPTLEAVSREMGSISLISEIEQKLALEEFSGVIMHSTRGVLGGHRFTRKAVERARGDSRAASIMNRVGKPEAAPAVADEIKEMESRQIFGHLRMEQAQTIAIVLSQLTPGKAAEVLGFFELEMREDIVERLGSIETIPGDAIAKVLGSLGRHFDTKRRPTMQTLESVQSVAAILNVLDKESSKHLLAKLEERNAGLGAAVRRKMFSFEDLLRLSAANLQRVMREVDSAQLAVAMKPSSEGLRAKIYAAMSKRAAEGLKEEIEMLGPTKVKDVEASQDAIIQIVRRLEEEGEVTLDEGGGDNAVI